MGRFALFGDTKIFFFCFFYYSFNVFFIFFKFDGFGIRLHLNNACVLVLRVWEWCRGNCKHAPRSICIFVQSNQFL